LLTLEYPIAYNTKAYSRDIYGRIKGKARQNKKREVSHNKMNSGKYRKK